MKSFRLPFSLLLGLVFLLGPSCASHQTVADGQFTRPLKGFERLATAALSMELSPAPSSAMRDELALKFSKSFGESLRRRLHTRHLLDYAEGPLLVLEGRLLKYEWTESPASTGSGALVNGSIEAALTFKDQGGARLGSVTVTATGGGPDVQTAMALAEKRLVYSLYKFMYKQFAPGVEAGKPEAEIQP